MLTPTFCAQLAAQPVAQLAARLVSKNREGKNKKQTLSIAVLKLCHREKKPALEAAMFAA